MSQATSRIIGDLSKEDDQMIRILQAVAHQSAHVMIGHKQIGVSIIFYWCLFMLSLIVTLIITNVYYLSLYYYYLLCRLNGFWSSTIFSFPKNLFVCLRGWVISTISRKRSLVQCRLGTGRLLVEGLTWCQPIRRTMRMSPLLIVSQEKLI